MTVSDWKAKYIKRIRDLVSFTVVCDRLLKVSLTQLHKDGFKLEVVTCDFCLEMLTDLHVCKVT